MISQIETPGEDVLLIVSILSNLFIENENEGTKNLTISLMF